MRMRKINKIIVHCTATPEGRDVSIDEVRRWHVDGRGWRDIGYHFLIQRDGTIEEGRPIEQTGAHVKGENWDSIGVAYVGGMTSYGEQSEPKDTRTDEQKDALIDLLCQLKDTYGGYIYGHNNFSNKACPCFDAKTEYENISNRY